MAQKLAIALIALFGLVNANILAGDAPNLAVNNIIDHRPQTTNTQTVVIGRRAVVVPQQRVVLEYQSKPVIVKRVETAHHDHDENDHNDDGHHHHDHEHQPKIQVPDVQFNRLKYRDDTKGQQYKAPHTIVTVPRVHNIVDQQHHVAINQRLGKSNCPECVKNTKRGEKVQKRGDKQFVRYDEQLQTQIEAPIKKTQVKQRHIQKDEHRETNYDKYDHLHRHDYVSVKPVGLAVKVVQYDHHEQDHHEHDHHAHDHDHDDHDDHDHLHYNVRPVVVNRNNVLLIDPPARRIVSEKVIVRQPSAHRIVAEKVIVRQHEDPLGEETLHDHHDNQEPHRHNNDDNIDRSQLPGQLIRGEIRENTPLAVGVLRVEGKKETYHHH